MENELATISMKGYCEAWKLPIPRQAYDTYVIRMKKIAQSNDPETAHFAADVLLTELLEELDCKEIVNAYSDVEKWYA